MIGQRFPWGDTITHLQANYDSRTTPAYDVSATRGYHPTYATGVFNYTSPVGAFGANGYGLYDMAGNVWEWCWDRQGDYGTTAVTAPKGVDSGSPNRMFRGGHWYFPANYARCAYRWADYPDFLSSYLGFRPARSSGP